MTAQLQVRHRRPVLKGIIAGVLTGIIIGAFVALLFRVNDNQRANTDALCALRADLDRRNDASKAFLLKHPHGVKDISVRDIKTSIYNTHLTIVALSPVSCPPNQPTHLSIRTTK